jgi:hydroxypyruvate reductase/glycerate 2-kinase
LSRARDRGLGPHDYLAANDAYAFFSRVNDLVLTGPTTTNVGDLQLVLFRNNGV